MEKGLTIAELRAAVDELVVGYRCNEHVNGSSCAAQPIATSRISDDSALLAEMQQLDAFSSEHIDIARGVGDQLLIAFQQACMRAQIELHWC